MSDTGGHTGEHTSTYRLGRAPSTPELFRIRGELVGKVVNPEDKPVSTRWVPVLLNVDDVYMYSFLVAEEERNNVRTYYVLRVDERSYYSEIATPMATVVSEGLLRKNVSPDEAMKTVMAYNMAITEVVDVVIEREGRFEPVGPRSAPKPWTPVYRPGPNVGQILLGEQEEPIEIGEIVGAEGAPTTIDLQSLTRHMLIVGSTGTGKSWLRGVLLEKIHELGIPQLVFDPLRDYTEAVQQLGGIVLRYGVDFLPALYELPPGLFGQMLGGVLTPLQRTIAVRGFEHYARRMKRALSPPTPREIAEGILAEIRRAAREMNAREETRENTLARVEALLRDLGYMDSRAPRILDSQWLANLINERRLIDFDLLGLGDAQFQTVVATVLMQILRLRERDEIDPLIVSFDETHRIAPRTSREDIPPSLIVIRDVARFGRHYGVGLIVITQYPDSVDVELIRLPATRIVFALDPDQAGAIRGLLKDLPPAARDLLPKLEKGTAFLTGTHDVVRHTVYVRITGKRTTSHGGITPRFRVRRPSPGGG